MTNHKPIIGLAGGIGAGKSFVAQLFGEMGCKVFAADQAVGKIYADPLIQRQLRQWWGAEVMDTPRQVNRAWIAQRIFTDDSERRRLEELIHPRVQQLRQAQMEQFANDPSILAFVWDVPLLFETGLNRQCDAVVFIESTLEQRLARVKRDRNWQAEELTRRENLQMPLDKKREISDYMVVNTADASETHRQVREILSRILSTPSKR